MRGVEGRAVGVTQLDLQAALRIVMRQLSPRTWCFIWPGEPFFLVPRFLFFGFKNQRMEGELCFGEFFGSLRFVPEFWLSLYMVYCIPWCVFQLFDRFVVELAFPWNRADSFVPGTRWTKSLARRFRKSCGQPWRRRVPPSQVQGGAWGFGGFGVFLENSQTYRCFFFSSLILISCLSMDERYVQHCFHQLLSFLSTWRITESDEGTKFCALLEESIRVVGAVSFRIHLDTLESRGNTFSCFAS